MNSSSEWYKNWFNSPFYLELYSHRDSKEAELFAKLIKEKINLEKSAKILDYCCGNGRLSLALAVLGYSITGIDLSRNLIDIAIEENRKYNTDCSFKLCDVRTFDEVEKYDLTVNFFTSFGYFSHEENIENFSRMCSTVKKGGYFVFDYLNDIQIKNNIIPEESRTFSDFIIHQKKRIENNRINKSIKIFHNGQDYSFNESVELYTKEEILKLNINNGMSVFAVFGDYNGTPYKEDSPRIITFAKKHDGKNII